MLYDAKNFLIIAFLLTLLVGCGEDKTPEKRTAFRSIKEVPSSSWKRLSEKKIYFGHQSVGVNIIDGMKGILKGNSQFRLNIVETNNPASFESPLFAHSRIGRNRNPSSKIESFAKLMNEGIGNKADFAFFKFCYVDISYSTDLDKIFREYTSTMLNLSEKYPETKFIHITVPLISKETGIKPVLKRILRRPLRDYEENIRRTKYNEMLRKQYDGKEPLFDLAKIESTLTDGTRLSYKKDGKFIFALIPDYTHDGGHLNEYGRKIVAEQLLIYLASFLQ